MTATDHPRPPVHPAPLAAPSADRRARTRGAARHKTTWADIDDTEAPIAHSVLLIHGQPGSALFWTQVLPLLHRHGLRVLAVDRPGYGHTGGAAIDQFGNAAALSQILQEKHMAPAVIVGHSLGAGIALALAAIAPDHVRALVLVAPAAGPNAITTTDRVLAAPIIGATLSWLAFRAAGLALHVPLLRQRVLTDRIGLSTTEADEVIRRITHDQVWRSFTAEQRHLITDAHLLQQRLGEIQCPVVIVSGTHDRIVRPRMITAITRRLPESCLTTTNTGHLIPIDDPTAVLNAVLHALRLDYQQSRAPRPERMPHDRA
jgi:pimeloyl-ACP methyl ester carboxylesterase